MKRWIREIYLTFEDDTPLSEMRAFIHPGGVHLECISAGDYPQVPDEPYRYHSIQYQIDNEQKLHISKMERQLRI